MARRTDFIKANTYTGQKITNAVVSLKIDGVRVLVRDGQIVTRNDKVPPGLEIACTEGAIGRIMQYGDCEIYMGNFLKTNGTLAQHNPEPDCITIDMIYPLVELDERLYIDTVDEVNQGQIEAQLTEAVSLGYEGLVIRCIDSDRWYRVKPVATADVIVTGWFEQLDKNKVPKGQLGGFDTNYGKVTAFTDADRKGMWEDPDSYIGNMITVQYKERYWTGKFRYAVKFLNLRTDKTEESFDTVAPLKG